MPCSPTSLNILQVAGAAPFLFPKAPEIHAQRAFPVKTQALNNKAWLVHPLGSMLLQISTRWK